MEQFIGEALQKDPVRRPKDGGALRTLMAQLPSATPAPKAAAAHPADITDEHSGRGQDANATQKFERYKGPTWEKK